MTEKRNASSKSQRTPRRKLHALYIVIIAALGTALVVALAQGTRGSGASAEQIAAATGTLSATRTTYDFGRISMKDGIVTFPFLLRNTGSEPALIRKLYTS